MKKIIFIGGSPTAGKTTTAKLLSEQIGLPWTSTDQIRENIRATANKKDYPALLRTKEYTAERFLKEFSATDIVKLEIDQAKEIWDTIKKLIKENPPWQQGVIIEGISILPQLVARDFKNDKEIKAVFMIDGNEDRIRNIVFKRGIWADADTYSDDVKEKEIEWALLASKTIKEEAEKHGYPVIEVHKDNNDLQSVIEFINSNS